MRTSRSCSRPSGRGLPVKLGLEIDRVPGRQDELAEIVDPYPWDFLLGSVHEVLDVAVDQKPGIWERLSVEDVWRDYVASVSDLAASGHVDVMSHPDLAKIYGRRPAPDVLVELHETLAASFAAAGVAVEVSTAGLRKPVRELYPSEALLRAFHGRGVPITIASDAHEPHLVGEDTGLRSTSSGSSDTTRCPCSTAAKDDRSRSAREHPGRDRGGRSRARGRRAARSRRRRVSRGARPRRPLGRRRPLACSRRCDSRRRRARGHRLALPLRGRPLERRLVARPPRRVPTGSSARPATSS